MPQARDTNGNIYVYDHHVNGWNVYVNGYGWGYSVAAIHQNTGRKITHFPTMNDAIQYCLKHEG